MARKGTQVAPPALRRLNPRRVAQATATGANTLQVLQPVALAKSGVKKRKLEAMSRDDDKNDKNCLSKPSKQGKGRLKAPAETTKDVAVEGGELTRFDQETTRFCELLEQDARRLPPPPPPLPKRRGVSKTLLKTSISYFELPFKAAEIKSLAERKSERRPPPYGKISRCVYVSTTMPVADLPVHKCACFEETCKTTTKRATQMASAKARREHLQDGNSATDHPLTRHADQQRQEELENAVYCGEGCHNRMLFISCSDDSCSAPDPRLCSNRAIQRRELKSVRVAYIPGPGFGLIANEKIRSGEFIIEYVGEVIDDEECERRMIKYRDNGETNFYMMELEKNIVIDAKYRSNESRFINHSCDPNSVTQKWNVGGIQRIGIFACRNIEQDEEITIDYNFSHFGEAVDCKCGSTACSGKIGLKRPKVVLLHPRGSGGAKIKKLEVSDEPPLELKRPVHVSSLALLKSAQLDESWLDLYGFQKRRLFISHQRRGVEATTAKKTRDDAAPRSASSSSSNSPASEWSATTEEDLSLTPPASDSHRSAVEKKPRERNWYEKVKAGEHLTEMRALHSYICGGKADWTTDLTAPPPAGKKGPGRPRRVKQPLPPLPTHGPKLNHKRLGLLEARVRCVTDIVRFANGKSKRNKQIPSSKSMDPDRICRFTKHMNDGQIFLNADQNDLNEDACYRCGLAGELICCDGCPAAFHLCCTNLVMVPPDGIPWFCSECTNPKHHPKATDHSTTAATTSNGSSDGSETDHVGRQLRTHATSLVPSLKKIFHSSTPHDLVKRRYKKRLRPTDRSYRLLEHMPLPVWTEGDESEAN